MLSFLLVKQRSTTPVSKKTLVANASIIAVTIMAVTLSPFAPASPVKADKYDAQIKALEQEINQYNHQAGKLENKRLTLQTQLSTLTNEKQKIQAKLDLSVAKANKLKLQISTNEDKIQDNKSVLGDTIADLYVDSNISPLEMLASSDNIADYVDKQANQELVQKNLQNTINKINLLKKKLEKQKKEVDQVVSDQKYAREALAKKENEKQNLISQTRGKESAFQKLSVKSSKQKKQLEEQQQQAIAARLAANNAGGGSAVAGSPSKGGYPSNLANVPMDSTTDPWGMYNRECVSYTAWKVYQKTGHMPYWGGVGNANQWPGNARAAGIGTGSTPRKGAVGIISAGAYGHAVYIESVNGDGTVNVSQYNYYLANGGGWGQYSEMYNVNPATYDIYIYFK